DDADDLPGANFVHWIRVVAQQDLLADGIFVGEELVDEFFIDDDDPGSGFGVVVIEIAAFAERNFQRGEGVGADFAVAGLRAIFWGGHWMTKKRERIEL